MHISTKLAPFLISLLQTIDPQVLQSLQGHIGKSGVLHLSDIKQSIGFIIQADAIKIVPPMESPSLYLSATVKNILGLVYAKDTQAPVALFIKNNITVLGDIGLLIALFETMTHFNFDWEGQLSRITGDYIAFHIGKTIKTTHRWLQEKYRHRLKDIGFFLEEERKIIPTQYELHAFYQQVDALLASSEKLEQRLVPMLNDVK